MAKTKPKKIFGIVISVIIGTIILSLMSCCLLGLFVPEETPENETDIYSTTIEVISKTTNESTTFPVTIDATESTTTQTTEKEESTKTSSTTKNTITTKTATTSNSAKPATTHTHNTQPATTKNNTTTQPPKSGTTVYITPTGKKYHYSSECAGPNAMARDLNNVSSSYGPCKKCAQYY